MSVEWEQSLGQLQLTSGTSEASNSSRQQQLPAHAVSTLPRGAPSVETTADSGSDEDLSEIPNFELPFRGEHVLEAFNLTALNLDSQLEKQVAGLAHTSIAPLVRYV